MGNQNAGERRKSRDGASSPHHGGGGGHVAGHPTLSAKVSAVSAKSTFDDDTGTPVVITSKMTPRAAHRPQPMNRASDIDEIMQHLSSGRASPGSGGRASPGGSRGGGGTTTSQNVWSRGPKERAPTTIKYRPDPKQHAKVENAELTICGTDGREQHMKMVYSTKEFHGSMQLSPGTYEYRFKVNGRDSYEVDPRAELVERDGQKFNVLHVTEQDFNMDQALDMDLLSTMGKNGKDNKYPDEFGQHIPHDLDNTKSHPPFLPPHLLQVILNKDTPLSCEPTLLPEPSQQMLNHLYALSIKDGVMVLSASQRYKNKYVTTLVYSPMEARGTAQQQQQQQHAMDGTQPPPGPPHVSAAAS